MTVFAFDEDDPQNPFGQMATDEVSRLPFGAAELGRDGTVLAYNDTEPDGFGGLHEAIIGRDFFSEVVHWAGGSLIADEFRKGVDSADLNVVFDCAVRRLSYKVRVHLKISPILGTYWVFIKKLARA